MSGKSKIVSLCLALAAPLVAVAADEPVLWSSKEIQWIDDAAPAAAKHAVLWGSAAGDGGTLVRWKFNTKGPSQVGTHDIHVLVLAGTLTVDVDGRYREFGPGGFIKIPKGIKHTMGCEAAGECTFLVHRPPDGDSASPAR